MKKILVASLVLSILDLGTALAQTQASQGNTQASPQVRYQKTTHYDFDNEQVEGSLVQPNDIVVDAAKKGAKSSLVKARATFIPEMLKSVDVF